MSFASYIAVFAICMSSEALFLALTSTHPEDTVELVLFGLFGGGFMAILLLGAMIFSRLFVPKRSSRASPRFSIELTKALAVSVFALALVSYVMHNPFAGLLVIVFPSLVVGTGVYAALRGQVISAKVVWTTVMMFSLFSLMIFLFGPLASRPARTPYEKSFVPGLRVLTWNLGLGQPGSAPSQSRYLRSIIATLREHTPHVICFQELASRAHLDSIREALGSDWQAARSIERQGMVTAIASNLPGQITPFDQEAPYGGPIAFRGTFGTTEFEVISIHLPPEGQSNLRTQLASRIFEHVNSRDLPTILCGDFNMDPEGFWDNFSTVFSDSTMRDRETIRILEKMGRDPATGFAATAVFARRLDRFYVSDEIRTLGYETVFNARRGRMDHRPVLLTAGFIGAYSPQ